MKLTAKWLLWFVLVTVYAAVIGGLSYYNLFKSVFDTKLQADMIAMVHPRASQFLHGLISRPKPKEGDALPFTEARLIKEMKAADSRIISSIYLNYDGSIRWHDNVDFLGKSYADYNNEVGFASNAPALAIRRAAPQAVLVDDGNAYDIAIPLLAKNQVVAGVVDLIVSREDARKEIRSAMVRYAIGVVIMLVLIGGVLYLFLLLKVIRPLGALKDSVEAVSLNNLTLNYPTRQDEVGDVAVSIESLLGKITEDIKSLEQGEIVSLEREKTWWKAIFAVAVPRGTRALVVDENNNVLYTNFELKAAEKRKVHLLDIFDGRQQGIIQILGEALEKPTKVLRGTVMSQNVKCTVRAVQLPNDAGKNRIVVTLEPVKK